MKERAKLDKIEKQRKSREVKKWKRGNKREREGSEWNRISKEIKAILKQRMNEKAEIDRN